jgi:uncharacterized membrane protein YkoI
MMSSKHTRKAMIYRLGLALLIGVLTASSAVADKGRGASSSDEAAAIARKSTGGRVLSVEPSGKNKSDYRVKVLEKDGRVRVLRIKGRGKK